MHFRFLFLLLLTTPAFSQGEKKILFRGDSVWYSGEGNLFFISRDKGIKWDTIFSKPQSDQPVFFYGAFDTATNVFISDQRTVFLFGWDGTMHNKTILFCSSDYGKTWSKSVHNSRDGVVGVKYLHPSLPGIFFLDLRDGYIGVSNDYGKTWKEKNISKKYHCYSMLEVYEDGTLGITAFRDKKCTQVVMLESKNNGATWHRYLV
jgi:photosystem II stability/assembly factor-like uncharacterized protein